MRANISYILALIALAIVCWVGASFVWGAPSLLTGYARLGLLALGSVLFGWALVLAARRLSAGVWIAIGLLLLVLLCLPFSTFTNVFPWQGGGFFPSSISFTLLVLFCAAIVVAALLIATGMKLQKTARNAEGAVGGEAPHQQERPLEAYACLSIGALLLLLVGYKFYWFMVWDSTYDPLTFLWLIFPIMAVCLAGVVLFIALPPGQKWIGLGYALLVSALLVGAYALAGQVDFRQLTAARAERLSQAIEGYHAAEGSYPQSLRQLTPRYALTLSEPVILYGEGWCYDGGDGFYRLGYVNRLHWSDPRLIGEVHSAQGAAPDLPPICAQEVAAIKARFPGYPFAYWDGE